MKPDTISEFFFAGAVAMPALLLWLGDPGLAVMVGVPLLLAGCLAALADAGAPFRSMAGPPHAPAKKPAQSGIRQTVPHARQRTRSHG
jgi:hypothetical protein